jgi:hypothetical protein
VTLRIARSRQRGIATNEIGISSVIIFVIALIVIYTFKAKTDASLACVTTAARIGEGTSPEGLKCPVSGKPYMSIPVCPDPDRHLRWSPRFDRDGSRQELPAAAPQTPTLEIGRKASYIAARQQGSQVIVDVRPRIWWRYLGGPIVHTICVLFVIAFLMELLPKERGPLGVTVVSLIAAVIAGWSLWATVPTTYGSQASQFDPATGKVTRHRYLFGKELAPETFDARGAAFVRSRKTLETYSLVLAVRGAPAVVLVDGLSEEDAVLGSWLRARFPR